LQGYVDQSTEDKDPMPARITILGIHPIVADEPCHLIGILVEDHTADLDFGKFTQQVEGQPRSDWQVTYDEQKLEEGNGRYAFFFHYLDFG